MKNKAKEKAPLGGLGASGARTIYIAGKISGLPIHEVTMKFGKAQKELEDLGYKAINPLEVVNDWKADWKDAMKLCIKALLDCEAVYFLPDHTQSNGAMLEKVIAVSLQMDIYEDIKDVPKLKTQKS